MTGRPRIGRIFGCVVFVFALTAPSADAGSEEDPELQGTGEVTYDPKYPGPKDHDYLGILAGWVNYDSADDMVEFHLKGVDYAVFGQAPPSDSTIICLMNATVYHESEYKGWLVFRFLNEYQADAFTANGDLHLQNPYRSPIPMKQEPNGTFSKPGYLEWRVSRNLLLNYADEMSNFNARCTEMYFPGQYPTNNVMPSSPIQNRGSVVNESLARFSLLDLRPADRPDDEDMFQGTASHGTAPITSAGKSPGPVWVTTLLALAICLALRFRR